MPDIIPFTHPVQIELWEIWNSMVYATYINMQFSLIMFVGMANHLFLVGFLGIKWNIEFETEIRLRNKIHVAN